MNKLNSRKDLARLSTMVVIATCMLFLSSNLIAYEKLTNTPNRSSFFGRFAMCQDATSPSVYHVIYDEEERIGETTYYKLFYQWVYVDRFNFVSEPMELWGVNHGCLRPTTPSIAMGVDGWLHVLAVRYKDSGPEQSELHYFAMQAFTGLINPLARHQIHLERQKEVHGRPGQSEHIMGTDIAFVAPNTIYAVWDQHDDIEPWEDPDDHDVFFNRSTDGGYSWLEDESGDAAPVLITNPVIDGYEDLKPRILVDNDPGRKIWVVYQRKNRGESQASDIRYTTSADQGDSWARPLRVTPHATEELSFMCPSIQQDTTGQLYISCRTHGSGTLCEEIRIYKFTTEPWPVWLEAPYSPVAFDASPDAPVLYPYYGCYPSFKVWGPDQFSIVYETHLLREDSPDGIVYVARYRGPQGYETLGPKIIYWGGFGMTIATRWVAHFDYPATPTTREMHVFWSAAEEGVTDGDILFDTETYEIWPFSPGVMPNGR